jgi:hypothetical protein
MLEIKEQTFEGSSFIFSNMIYFYLNNLPSLKDVQVRKVRPLILGLCKFSRSKILHRVFFGADQFIFRVTITWALIHRFSSYNTLAPGSLAACSLA